MHSKSDRPSEDDPRSAVGFGHLAYDPVTRTYWYYGLGLSNDHGASLVSPTNFGSKSIEDLCNILKYQVSEIAEDLHNRAMEKVNDKTKG